MVMLKSCDCGVVCLKPKVSFFISGDCILASEFIKVVFIVRIINFLVTDLIFYTNPISQ